MTLKTNQTAYEQLVLTFFTSIFVSQVTNIKSELVTTISDDFKPLLIVTKLSVLAGILDIRLGTLLLMVLYEWCGMQIMLLYLAKPQKLSDGYGYNS